jgi:hypothetical protein
MIVEMRFGCSSGKMSRLDFRPTGVLHVKLLRDILFLNIAIFCDIPPCNHLLARWFLGQLMFDPEDEVDTLFRNFDSFMDYTALYPRK